ncbi:hypothetical protein ABEG18_18000 [Alsobacter sp. KACC 23698]|uniref:Uncharacterized protein n=1 Tax=Alsobacter sp. KACC 23698 TaxID=3149229 RepID=A0AAU7JBA6_9HYPH
MVDKSAFNFLAQLIVRIRPEAADAVFPHGPIGALGAAVERREHARQPQPTREVAVIAAADAHLAEIIALTRTAEGVGGETGKNLVRLALSKVADFDELCPRWPKWPIGWPPVGHWPPPPPPPWWWEENEKLNAGELFLAGSRMLAAADAVRDASVGEALANAGRTLMDKGLQGAR